MLRREAMLALAGSAVPLALSTRTSNAQTPAAATPYAYPYVQVLQLGVVSFSTCEILLSRSQNAATRTFAQIEIIEQVAVAQALTSNYNPVPPALTPDQQAIINTLNTVPANQVDVTFVTAQIAAHQTLLAIQQAALTVYAPFTTYDIVHETLLIRSNLEQHLVLLNQILPTLT